MNETIWHTRVAAFLRKEAVAIGLALLVLAAVVVDAAGRPGAVPDAGTQSGEQVLYSLTYRQEPVLSGAILDIEREIIQVKVYVDGENSVVDVYKGSTVEQALQQASIELNPLDIVNLPMGRQVEAGNQIDIERRLRVIQTERTEVPFDKVDIATPLLAEGQVRVLTQGAVGVEIARYSRYIVDGEIIEEELVEEYTESTPVTQVQMVGFNGASVSQMDFEWEFEDGAPASYEAVHTAQKATGYTAGAGARTASGREAIVGHVAVNPSVIPYGSKLYIQSADGQFVYGYAIAADTGGALLDGTVGVDLFYDSYTEAALNGVRTVDIYVLEYPQ